MRQKASAEPERSAAATEMVVEDFMVDIYAESIPMWFCCRLLLLLILIGDQQTMVLAKVTK
jgi:hypothetical protein